MPTSYLEDGLAFECKPKYVIGIAMHSTLIFLQLPLSDTYLGHGYIEVCARHLRVRENSFMLIMSHISKFALGASISVGSYMQLK